MTIRIDKVSLTPPSDSFVESQGDLSDHKGMLEKDIHDFIEHPTDERLGGLIESAVNYQIAFLLEER